jgi:hypothetical protein
MLEYLNDLIKTIPYIENKEERHSVFADISGYYYHENYHSDILAYYFSFETVKKALINWINELLRNDNKINFDDYIHGEIIREYKNIDILLINNSGKNAIIIENKSNNAVDQKDQIYRYYKILMEEGRDVDAIIYLNKNALKNPNLSNIELSEISNILIKAQLVGVKNSFEDVLNSVIQTTSNIRLNALSCEIRDLFYTVIYGGINMDNLDLFVDELLQDDNLQKLRNSVKAYNQLPVYFAHKYKSYIESKNNNFDL